MNAALKCNKLRAPYCETQNVDGKNCLFDFRFECVVVIDCTMKCQQLAGAVKIFE